MTRFRTLFVAGGLLCLPMALIAQTAPAPTGVTLDQFKTMAAGRMKALDVDGDGKISAKEFSSRPQKARSKMMADRMFARLDANGDGSLDKGEIDAMLAKRFARLDANKDGVLTAEERQAARGAMQGAADDPQ